MIIDRNNIDQYVERFFDGKPTAKKKRQYTTILPPNEYHDICAAIRPCLLGMPARCHTTQPLHLP